MKTNKPLSSPSEHWGTQEHWHLISKRRNKRQRRQNKRAGWGEKRALPPAFLPNFPSPLDLPLPLRMLKNTHQPPPSFFFLSLSPSAYFTTSTVKQCLVWQQNNTQVKKNTKNWPGNLKIYTQFLKTECWGVSLDRFALLSLSAAHFT